MKKNMKMLPIYRVPITKKRTFKKKTHEEYVAEVAVKNPNIEVIGEYINAKTKIEHHCLVHNIYWNSLPGNILSGKGCHNCMKDKNRLKFVKSHDEYVCQVKNKNPNIEVLETYIGAKTSILHLCKKHNIEWKAMPSNILKGYGCIECKKEKIINSNLKSHKEYVKELELKNPYLKLKENYINSHTPILHYCVKHNLNCNLTPSNALRGSGCSECHKEKINKALAKSHDNYIYELSIKNPHVKVMEQYNNSKTKLLHYCTIHDVYWKTTPSIILAGCGCPECYSEKMSNKIRKTNQWYVDKLKKVNPTVIAIEQYIDARTPVLHKCLIHDFEWMTSPMVTLQGCGCPKCKSEKIRNKVMKSHEEYIEELKKINPDIIALEQYNGVNSPILHKCFKDNNEWYVSPVSILHGYGCPMCNESKGERKIRILLDKYNIKYETQKTFIDCKDIKLLPFDFYLPEYNTVIEFDGRQHYEPVDFFGGQEAFEYINKHDRIKTEYCKNNGILLLRIPYYKDTEEELNNFLFI